MERDYPVEEYVIAVTGRGPPNVSYLRAVILAIETVYALPDFLKLFCDRVVNVLGLSDEGRADLDTNSKTIILR